MAFTQTAAPAAEPISLADAKAFLRVDHDADDPFISSLIVTSRLQVETALDLALMTQSWRWRGRLVPGGTRALRPHPVRTIDGVAIRDDDDVATALAPASFSVDLDTRPATVTIRAAHANRYDITFTAGFGDTASDVPAPIRQALLQLIAHWYENREPIVIGETVARIPDTVSSLLMAYREAKL